MGVRQQGVFFAKLGWAGCRLRKTGKILYYSPPSKIEREDLSDARRILLSLSRKFSCSLVVSQDA